MVVLEATPPSRCKLFFDLRHELACCKFAIGLQHRFAFNSSLHGDNAVVLELRIPVMFRDHPPPPPNPTR